MLNEFVDRTIASQLHALWEGKGHPRAEVQVQSRLDQEGNQFFQAYVKDEEGGLHSYQYTPDGTEMPDGEEERLNDD